MHLSSDKLNELDRMGGIDALNNKPYINHTGLLILAEGKIAKLESTIVHARWDEGVFFFRTTITTTGGSIFTGYGDAGPRNVSKNIAIHSFRMAETRSVNRALRFMLGMGGTTAEEFGDTADVSPLPPAIDPPSQEPSNRDPFLETKEREERLQGMSSKQKNFFFAKLKEVKVDYEELKGVLEMEGKDDPITNPKGWDKLFDWLQTDGWVKKRDKYRAWVQTDSGGLY